MSNFDEIEHVVVLMMENRSFDSVLGWLYENGEEPDRVVPELDPARANYDRSFNGLDGINLDEFVNEATLHEEEFSLKPKRGASASNVPDVSPQEPYEHVNEQLYGSLENPDSKEKANMKGFAKNFVRAMEVHGKNLRKEDQIDRFPQVMETYTSAQLPVLNGLAKHYAVSDLWFSSVPTQTNVNRAFLLMGTSNGSVNNSFFTPFHIPGKFAFDEFKGRTVFNVLEEKGEDWSVFWHDEFPPLFHKGRCYTRNSYAELDKIEGVDNHFARMPEFHRRARLGELPFFSYIEPSWGFGYSDDDDMTQILATQIGNDYHPPRNMKLGENLILSVYNSLVANEESWDKTLFMVTFDEHVGAFDHVSPPWGATPPWGECKPSHELQSGFGFDRFGVRIPTLLISPRISPQTVFRSTGEIPYDHTSVAATLFNKLGIPRSSWNLGERMQKAPTFDEIIDLSEPRRDLFGPRRVATDEVLRTNDQFYLKNERTGDYLAASPPKWLALRRKKRYRPANTPCLGRTGKAPFSFFTGTENGVIANGAEVQFGSHQFSLEEKFMICVDPELPQCNYEEQKYEDAGFQEWIVSRTGQNDDDPDPIHCGEKIHLLNELNGSLRQEGDHLVTSADEEPDTWLIESIPLSTGAETVVNYGDLVHLKCFTSGEYLSVTYDGQKLYPSASNVGPIALRIGRGQEEDIQLQSSESGLGECNLLGAWTLDHFVYYYEPDDEAKQSWAVERVDRAVAGPLKTGEAFHLVNRAFQQNLAIEGDFLSTEKDRKAIWVFESIVEEQTGS